MFSGGTIDWMREKASGGDFTSVRLCARMERLLTGLADASWALERKPRSEERRVGKECPV